MNTMNKKIITTASIALVLSFNAAAQESWLDSLKNMLGMGEEKAAQVTEQVKESTQPNSQATIAGLNVTDLLGNLTQSLDVNSSQAEGGLASIMSYVKNNVSSGDFGKLAGALPGLDGILSAAPDVSKMASKEGLGQLLDTASQYSDSAKAVNDLKKQFESLGLSTDMVTQFISKIMSYLDSPEGAEAKKIIADNVSQFI